MPNAFPLKRSQAVISSKKICHNVVRLTAQGTDLLIAAIVLAAKPQLCPRRDMSVITK